VFVDVEQLFVSMFKHDLCHLLKVVFDESHTYLYVFYVYVQNGCYICYVVFGILCIV
jgi:hypothetical protein